MKTNIDAHSISRKIQQSIMTVIGIGILSLNSVHAVDVEAAAGENQSRGAVPELGGSALVTLGAAVLLVRRKR